MKLKRQDILPLVIVPEYSVLLTFSQWTVRYTGEDEIISFILASDSDLVAS